MERAGKARDPGGLLQPDLERDVLRLSDFFLLPLREKVARLGRMRGIAKRMM